MLFMLAVAKSSASPFSVRITSQCENPQHFTIPTVLLCWAQYCDKEKVTLYSGSGAQQARKAKQGLALLAATTPLLRV